MVSHCSMHSVPRWKYLQDTHWLGPGPQQPPSHSGWQTRPSASENTSIHWVQQDETTSPYCTVTMTQYDSVLLCMRTVCVITYHRFGRLGCCWRCSVVLGWDGGYSSREVNWCSTAGDCCVVRSNLHWRCAVNVVQEIGCVHSEWPVKKHP